MEILQTIWNALTTENIMLVNLINIPLIFIEMYVSMLLFTSILNIKASSKQKLLYVLILSIIGLLTVWTVPVPYNTIINIIACPILVYFIFKTTLIKSILSEIIPYIFFVLLSLLLQSFCVRVFNLTTNELLYIPLYKVLTSLLVYTCVFTLYIIFLSKNINIKSLVNNKLLLINLIIGIIALIIEYFILFSYASYLTVSTVFVSLFILLLYFCINMYSLARTSTLEITTEKLEEERLYNKTITILYDNIRGFKHDFNNIVQAIGGYISTDNLNGLKDYYSDLLSDCQKVNNLAILNPELINNPAIYSLLTSKYHNAEELGIKMILEIFLDLQTLNIKTYDLTRILGILLDNAIEASSNCNKKEIHITIRKDNKANRQLFIIENTYSNKDVNTDRIFEKGYTSKADKDTKNHGLGLWEVRQILKKNNNLNLFTTKTDELFKQQLEIYL